MSNAGSSTNRRTVSGPRTRLVPFNFRVIPNASVSFPGPDARSSIRRAFFRRRNIRSIPHRGSTARISAHPACPSGSHTKFRHSYHTVNEINVRVSRRTENHLRARRDAMPGMRRPVVHSQVGFRFDDPPRGPAVHQDLSQTLARHLHHIARVKILRQNFGSGKQVRK